MREFSDKEAKETIQTLKSVRDVEMLSKFYKGNEEEIYEKEIGCEKLSQFNGEKRTSGILMDTGLDLQNSEVALVLQRDSEIPQEYGARSSNITLIHEVEDRKEQSLSDIHLNDILDPYEECDLCEKHTTCPIPLTACAECIENRAGGKGRKENKNFGVKLAMVLYVFLSMAIIALLSILFFRLNIKYNDLENDYDNLMEENKQNKFRSYSANKILLDRNLISQLSAKFKYPSYPKIETLDLNLENRIFTLKEELSPHFDNSPITGRNQRGFCTVSLKEGFDIWEKKGKYIYQLYRTDSNDGLQHQNGVLNSQGIYIVAGNADNDVKVYSFANIVHPYPKIALIKTFSRDYLVNTCFVKGSNEVLCPDLGGYVKKYNFTDLSESEFYFEADQEFISGVVTINGIVALGADYGGNLYLLNSDGSENNTYHYNEGDEDHATHQITEIKPGILLTANYIGGIYSHDITDPQNPKFYNLFQSPHTPEQYYSVLSLKKHNYFAVGGRKGANLYGFVTIYSISEDNRGTVQQKYIERKHPSCYISTIREFEGELIAFGGNIFCLQICLWEYSSTHGEPFCWADDTIFDVTDIFLLPQT